MITASERGVYRSPFLSAHGRGSFGRASRVKVKVPNSTDVEHALELVGFKIAGHPTVMSPFVLIECFLDPALGKSPSGNLEEPAAPALDHWRDHGVSWNQVGNHLLVFIRQKRRTGRPAGPERNTETQAAPTITRFIG
jgi:hypothetical protein